VATLICATTARSRSFKLAGEEVAESLALIRNLLLDIGAMRPILALAHDDFCQVVTKSPTIA
jgi:hypothetical protein